MSHSAHSVEISGQITKETIWARCSLLPIGLFMSAGFILLFRFEDPMEGWEFGVVLTVGTAVYSVLALLIIRRHPRHTIGWLFLLMGIIGALIIFDAGLLAWAAQSDSIVIQEWTAWFDRQVIAPWIAIPLTLVLLYFPDGRLPSPRWKPITILVIILLVYTQTSEAFLPWTTEETDYAFIVSNPIAIPESEIIFHGVIGAIFSGLGYLGILGALASVVVRFKRSKGIERMQMKWLVYIAIIVVVLIMLLGLLDLVDGVITFYVIIFSPALIALAIGAAILRYRLFDIDIIIRRTLQYALLTGLLALIYYGGVVLLQGIFGQLTGETNSPLVTVITTLGIAALFNPLRGRVQDFIDRRFYRAKYDAEQTLAQFAAVARDEVDMDKLAAAMLNVVDDTIQPEQASLWVKRIMN